MRYRALSTLWIPLSVPALLSIASAGHAQEIRTRAIGDQYTRVYGFKVEISQVSGYDEGWKSLSGGSLRMMLASVASAAGSEHRVTASRVAMGDEE